MADERTRHGHPLTPAYYNDHNPYCCRVLRTQIAAGALPLGDVDERDIRDVHATDLAGYGQIHLFAGIGGFPLACRMVGLPDDSSLITGGFPCQDISRAGKRAGIDGERSGLWREFHRLICALRPRYVLVENVSNLLRRDLGRVLGDLAGSGYDAQWSVVSACAVGAPHARERVFILAYPAGQRCETCDVSHRVSCQAPMETVGTGQWQCQFAGNHGRRVRAIPDRRVCRMADGVPPGLDRLSGLGNAVVPHAACVPLRIVASMERQAEAS